MMLQHGMEPSRTRCQGLAIRPSSAGKRSKPGMGVDARGFPAGDTRSMAGDWEGSGLDRGRWAIGVRPQRIYLRTDGTRDTRPERKIVDLSRRPQWPLEERHHALSLLLSRLQESCSGNLGRAVKLFGDAPDRGNAIRLVASRDDYPANASLRCVHEHGGFFAVPDGMAILLCHDEDVAPAHTEDYRRRAVEAFAERGVNNMSVNFSTLERLEARLDELGSRRQGQTPGRAGALHAVGQGHPSIASSPQDHAPDGDVPSPLATRLCQRQSELERV